MRRSPCPPRRAVHRSSRFPGPTSRRPSRRAVRCRCRDVAGRSVREAALALHRRGFRVSLHGMGRVTRTVPGAGSDRLARARRLPCGRSNAVILVRPARRAPPGGSPSSRLLPGIPPLTGVDVDSRTVSPGGAVRRGARLAGGRPSVRGRRGPPRARPPSWSSSPQPTAVPGDRGARRAPRGARARRARGTVIPPAGSRSSASPAPTGRPPPPGCFATCFNGAGTAGSIGTLGAFDGRGEAVPSTAGSLTTPGPVDLQADARGAGRARGHPRRDGDVVAQPRPGPARRADVRRPRCSPT